MELIECILDTEGIDGDAKDAVMLRASEIVAKRVRKPKDSEQGPGHAEPEDEEEADVLEEAAELKVVSCVAEKEVDFMLGKTHASMALTEESDDEGLDARAAAAKAAHDPPAPAARQPAPRKATSSGSAEGIAAVEVDPEPALAEQQGAPQLLQRERCPLH